MDGDFGFKRLADDFCAGGPERIPRLPNNRLFLNGYFPFSDNVERPLFRKRITVRRPGANTPRRFQTACDLRHSAPLVILLKFY
jgi:hypothetical protein